MDTNISFGYRIAEIMDGIEGEISRHAAFLRFQDGGSAYDTLLIHTNERPTIEGFVADAFRSVLAKFDGDGIYDRDKDKERGFHRLSFRLPDFDEDNLDAARDELLRHVVLSATANWLAYRSFADYAKLVSMEADSSLNRLVAILRTRKFPIE